MGHCVHRLAMHPSRPEVLFMQKHWDVMRSEDAGESWEEVSGDLPTDFGFAIDVHAHEPETVYVVPIKSDSEHFPPEGKLRVYRSRTGRQRVGTPHKRTSPGQLLCERAARRDGGRLARRPAGSISARPGARSTHPPIPATAGPRSCTISRRVLSVEVQTLSSIRVVLPAHLRELARAGREVALEVAGPVTQRTVLAPSRLDIPVLKGTIRDPITKQRRAFVRFFACEEDLSHVSPGPAAPQAIAAGRAILRCRGDGRRLRRMFPARS